MSSATTEVEIEALVHSLPISKLVSRIWRPQPFRIPIQTSRLSLNTIYERQQSTGLMAWRECYQRTTTSHCLLPRPMGHRRMIIARHLPLQSPEHLRSDRADFPFSEHSDKPRWVLTEVVHEATLIVLILSKLMSIEVIVLSGTKTAVFDAQ